jgi:hypothetical protein
MLDHRGFVNGLQRPKDRLGFPVMEEKPLTPEQQKAIEAAIAEGLKIQHLFDAEPTLKKEGCGTMRSEGVEPFEELKKREKGKEK